MLRRKLANVLEAAGLTADSHDGQDLTEILEGYPREELFQISAEELTPIAVGVLGLRQRRQTRLFLRKDYYGRYMSCMVYLPRDRYTTPIRLRVQEILRAAFDGVSVDYAATVTESALARLHVVVRIERGRSLPEVDAARLERKLAATVRSWDDDLAEEATRTLDERQARALLEICRDSIPETYKADVPAEYALTDLTRVLSLLESDRSVAFDLWKAEGYAGGRPVPEDPADDPRDGTPAGLEADHLPDGFADHAHGGAAAPPAHGG